MNASRISQSCFGKRLTGCLQQSDALQRLVGCQIRNKSRLARSSKVQGLRAEGPKGSAPVSRRLVVALGNPGTRFTETRHNIGFRVADHFVQNLLPHMQKDSTSAVAYEYHSQLYGQLVNRRCAFSVDASSSLGLDLVDQKSERRRSRTIAGGGACFNEVDVTVLLPQAYMNLSGMPVGKVIEHFQMNPVVCKSGPNFEDEMLVVFDDLDIPFGQFRFSTSGSSGGHNGVKSIIDCVGTDKFCRLRVGIGSVNKDQDVPTFVMSPFNREENRALPGLLASAAQLIRTYVHRGREETAEIANTLVLEPVHPTGVGFEPLDYNVEDAKSFVQEQELRLRGLEDFARLPRILQG